MSADAYPLQWPDGWPRTPQYRRESDKKFGGPVYGGSTMMERAFSGFAALTPPDWKKPWRQVFGVPADWRGDITALYREKARNRHPDAGGSDTLMAELNVAYEEAKRELGA